MKPSERRFKGQNDQMGSDKTVNPTTFLIHSKYRNYNDHLIFTDRLFRQKHRKNGRATRIKFKLGNLQTIQH